MSIHSVIGGSIADQAEHLCDLLAKPVFAGRRRIPGFRLGDPRLLAMAAALVQMPFEFRTAQAAPAVARLLGRSPNDYRLTHFRYDLTKLRARNLAEKIGTTRRYRLTRIGRVVCQVLAKARQVASANKTPAAAVENSRSAALSA